MILVINTAHNENIFLGLWDKKWLEKNEWSTGHNLTAEIMDKIAGLYKNTGKTYKDTTGVMVNTGPGSFTGLRIGISIANTMAYSLNIPIVGLYEIENKPEFMEKELQRLCRKKAFEKVVFPEYGKEPNITQSKNRKSC